MQRYFVWNSYSMYHPTLLSRCEILKNTQWDIFHIFTSEDIDHMTFSVLNRTLHGGYEGMTFIVSC
jgi:hypothetical protein